MNDMKSSSKGALWGLGIGLSAFSVAALVGAGLLYGLSALAEAQSQGILEAWFWLGGFPILGGIASGGLAFAGWMMIGGRLDRASLSPARRRRYSLVSGGALGVATGWVCALSSSPLILTFSPQVAWGWLFGVAIGLLPAIAGLAAGFLLGWLLQRGEFLDGAPPVNPPPTVLRALGLLALPPLGSFLAAVFCAGSYYAVVRGDLFLNTIFLGVPAGLIAFIILTLVALWMGLPRMAR